MASSLNQLFQKEPIVLLDGAMGTELAQRGVDTSLPLWSADALESAPQIVAQIHRDYVDAGAHILTANTFRTTAFSYTAAGYTAEQAAVKADEMTILAISMAKEAAGERALVAASIAPVADCYTPAEYVGPDQALATYTDLCASAKNAGADVMLVETQITIEETAQALAAAKSTGVPILASFLVDSDLNLWGGAPLRDAVTLAENEGVAAVMINCVTLQAAARVVPALAEMTKIPFGIYANAGLSSPEIDGTIEALHPDDQFAQSARSWIRDGASIIGGCCGSRPSTISALNRVISELDSPSIQL